MPKKLYCNEEFFSLKTKKTYYWAGFIAADGCVTQDNRLEIALKLADRNHLELFKHAIGSRHPVSISHQGKAARIRIRSKKLCEDLESNFNITPNKSKTLQYPNIVEDYLMWEYIRGYMDGDGCYSIIKTENPRQLANLILVSGSVEFLEEIADIFNLYINNYKYPRYNSHVYRISYGIKDSNVLINKIYQYSSVNTRLLRKYNKIKKQLDKGIVQ